MLYDKVFFGRGKTRSYILVFDQIGLYLLLAAQPVLMYVFIYFLEINIWLTIVGTFVITGLLFVLGFFYLITVSTKSFQVFMVVFFVPFQKIRKTITDVKIGKYYPDNAKDINLVYVFHDYDPWCEMGLCDWVEIECGNTSFPIGSNKNYEQILRKVEFELDRYR